MKDITKKSWKIAIFFILFELFFWTNGNDSVYAIKYMIEDGDPFIANIDESGVFHNWIEAGISLIFLFLSVLCLQQFIKNLVEEIRHNGHG